MKVCTEKEQRAWCRLDLTTAALCAQCRARLHLRQEVEDGSERWLGLVVPVEEERVVAGTPRVLEKSVQSSIHLRMLCSNLLTLSETPHEVIPMH